MIVPRKRKVTYSLVGGELPQGLVLDPNTGKIRGLTSTGIFYDGPTWVTSDGNLGNYNELDEVQPIQLTATTNGTATSIKYTIVSQSEKFTGMPWGLFLNPDTGVITGTIAELVDPFAASFTEDEAPVWETAGGRILETAELSSVSGVFISAIGDQSRPINYAIVAGTLPWGLTLDAVTGQITGNVRRLKSIGEITVFEPKPSWISNAGNLGNFKELEAVSLSVRARPLLGTSLKYSIVEGGLPWGLRLSASSGNITGTTAKLVVPGSFSWPSEQTPVWLTSSGRLGDVDEYQAADFTVNADAYLTRSIKYSVTRGFLPLGLELDESTGRITGNAARLVGPISVPIFEPKPTWNTNGGNLGTFDEYQSVSVSISADANFGETLTYFIVDGGLPWGLELNATTGAITGTTKNNPNSEVAFDVGNNPTFGVDNDQTIATQSLGQTVDYTIPFTLGSGRTLKTIEIVPSPNGQASRLPAGLTLNETTGQISGTISSNNAIQTYSFLVRITDNLWASSTISLKIVVNT